MGIFRRFFRFFFHGGLYDSAKQSPARQQKQVIVDDARTELPPAERMTMISAARDLIRNHGFAREIVSSMDIYSVGDGIFPQACTSDPKWNAEAERVFREWSQKPEITGRFSFQKCLSMVCRALDVDGEIFAVKTLDALGGPKLQFFEAHRCVGGIPEKAIDGIEFDVDGTPISYSFDSGIPGIGLVGIPASQVIHVFVAERFSDAHGIPQIQHAVNGLLDASELISIEKKSVKTAADVSVVIESDRIGDSSSEYHANPDEEDQQHAAESQTDPDELRRILGGGKIGKLGIGEKLKTFESQRPSSTFTGFLDYILKDAALGNIPYEFVADSSKIGGAGVRLVVGRAARKFSRRQQELIEGFLNPVWKFVVGLAILRGILPEKENWTAVEWATPKSVTVDAGRERAQDREDVLKGFGSIEDFYAERGMSYRREVRRIAAAAKLARETAEEFGVPVETVFTGAADPAKETEKGEDQK